MPPQASLCRVFVTVLTLACLLTGSLAFATDPPEVLEPVVPKVNRRGARIQRWELAFTKKDAKDYLDQLAAMGVFLGIPDTKGKLMIIRDLKERPAKPKYEDVKQINRAWMIDDGKESAEELARELDLDVIPSVVVAFYPRGVEDELAAKEKEAMQAKGIKEEGGVLRTKFRVTFKDGKASFAVAEVIPKDGPRKP